MAEKFKSTSEKQLDEAMAASDKYNAELKSLDPNKMPAAKETEPQTKLSSKELDKAQDVYIKPNKTVSCREKFNEKYRDEYNFAAEYVHIIAEHKEIIGELVELWTKPFAGVPAEFWQIPPNKPVWVPRYVAERIKGCTYRRLTSENKLTEQAGVGQFYGQMTVESVIQRLDAHPAAKRKSIFMGASNF